MRALLARADHRHLAVLRVSVFGIWLGVISTIDSSVYSTLPPELIDPKGIAQVLPLQTVMASPILLALAKWATVIGCAACVVGLRPYPLIAGVTTGLIFFHDAAMKAVGAWYNHGQAAILVAAVILAAFPAADSFSLGKPRRDTPASPWLYRAPLIAVASILATAYSFIAARRIFIGATEVFTDGSIVRWIVVRTLEYDPYGLDIIAHVLEREWLFPLLGAGLFVTTVFELLTPLVFRSDRFRRVWLSVIVAFHLSTLLAMNIFFWENLILITVLFTPVNDWIVDRVSGRSGDARHATASETGIPAGDRVSP